MDQSALALTIGMAGVVVLLLAGTQVLDWYWIALLTVASLGTGLYRLRKSIPSDYKLAQRIDHRLSLADTLSTAAHFSSSTARGDQAIRERQRREADQIAGTVDIRQGIPFVRPRFVYAAAGLAAAAFGLFALRYAVTGSLSLQPSLVRIAFDTFFPPKPELARANRRKLPDQRNGTQIDPNSTSPQDDLAMDPELQNVPAYENPQNMPVGQDNKDGKAKMDPDNSSPAQEGNDAKQDSGSKAEGAPTGESPNSNEDAKDGAKQASKQGSGNDGSSLMNKLRDAMADMMNKVKSNQSPPTDQKGQKSDGRDKSNQKGATAQQHQEGASSAGQSDQQDADAGDKQPSNEGGPAQGSDAKAAPDSKSGIGSADGDKTARDAEQLAAMGKLSEIIGKRSANVTGEMMVEMGSSKQQLKTPWAQSQAAHAEAGGEIHRDEVPLIYQQFVQQYFEEIRKAPDSRGEAKSGAAKSQ